MLDYSYRCHMLWVCILSEFMVTQALWLTGSEVYTKDCYYCQRILPISYKKEEILILSSYLNISLQLCWLNFEASWYHLEFYQLVSDHK